MPEYVGNEYNSLILITYIMRAYLVECPALLSLSGYSREKIEGKL